MLLSRDMKIHVVILVDIPLYDGEPLTESGEEQNKIRRGTKQKCSTEFEGSKTRCLGYILKHTEEKLGSGDTRF